MHVARSRRLVGLLTLLALLVIFVGVSGVQVPLPRFLSSATDRPPLPGVRAVAAGMLLRVGAGAPAGGELAFMAVEPVGNLVVSDARRRVVMRFDQTGHLLSEWGPQFDATFLDEPAGVAVQGDTWYVLDRGTPRIFRLDDSGHLLGTLSLESFGTYGLNGLAVDVGGNIFVADTGRNRILMLSPTGKLLRAIGHSGIDLGGMTQPMMLAFAADGSFFIADWENSRIERFDATFQATEAWVTGFHSFGVAVDQVGRVFATDTDRRRLEVYSAQGASLGEIGGPGSLPIDIAPRQLAVSHSDPSSIYVLGSDGIQRVDLENTAAPPQDGGSDIDPVSLAVIALLAGVLVLAVISRRARRPLVSSVGAAPDGPVRLQAENGAQGQDQQPGTDQDLLVTHETERER